MTRIRIHHGFDNYVEGELLGTLQRPVISGGKDVAHVILALDSGALVVEPIEYTGNGVVEPTIVRPEPDHWRV